MTIKSLNTNPASRSFFRSPAAKLGLVSLVALGVAAGCGDDDDDDPADPVPMGGAGGGMMTEGGAGGMMAGGAGGMMAGGTGGMMAGGAGGMMAGGAGGMGMGPTGVAYPTGWQDWPVIGIADREPMTNHVRIVVGNEIAVTAARGATTDDGKVETWPDGSILVDVVWARAADTTFAGEEYYQAGNFNLIAVMQKDAQFASTGGWGYAAWAGDAQTPNEDAMALQECYNCHNDNVPNDDYVFTRPIQIATSTETSGDGLTLPADADSWKLIGVHRRADGSDGTPGQIRLVTGNDIAVDAARAAAGGVVDSWPDGAQLLDRVYSSQIVHPAFDTVFGPNALAVSAFMEKDSVNFTGDRNGWGYAVWAGGLAAETRTQEQVDDACRACHELDENRATNTDDVFTVPAVLPTSL